MNRRLRQLDTGNLLLTTGTCRRDEFIFNGTGWDAPPGVFATLVQNPDGSYTETFPSGTTHTFDANGNLIEIRDRHGNRIALEYSAQKMPIQGRSEFFVDSETRVVTMEYRLEKIIAPTTPEVTFGYHAENGRIATITDWTGRVWQYDYDDFGNLIKVTSPPIADYPQGTFTTYHYGDPRFPHKITKVIPPNGQATQTARVQNIYDDEGRVIQQNLGNGSTVTVAYDSENQTTTVTDGNGTDWIYTYENGQIISRTVVTRGIRDPADEPAGTTYVTTYEYNGDSLQSRIVFPEGNAIERVYDSANQNVLARGNLIEIRHLPKPGSGETPIVTSFSYKTPFQQPGTISDPNGNITEYFYDAIRNLERIKYPAVPEGTPQEFYTINTLGQLTSLTDANGNTTTFGFDANGYLDVVTRAVGTPLAAATEFDPDSLGRPSVIRDANGHVTQLSFNAWDLIEERTAPLPFGYVTEFRYDGSGNLARIEEQSEIPGDPQTTTLTYNVRDWMLTRENELNEKTSLVYDQNGNLAEIRDSEGTMTLRVFDERNLRFTQTEPNGDTVTFHYHPNALLARVLDGNGNLTVYDTDDFDRLKTTTYADGTTQSRIYDPAGDVLSWTTRAGDNFTLSYDDRHQLRGRTTPVDSVTFAYDLGGRMTSASNSSVSLAYSYNSLGQLISETTTISGLSPLTVAHDYDRIGNVQEITYPDGTRFVLEYDVLNRLHVVRDAIGAVLEERGYDELSRVTHRIRSNGSSDLFRHDRASRIEAVIFQGSSSVLDSLSYSRDPTGTITTLTDNQGIHSFSYDPAKQLTSADYPEGSPFEDVSVLYDDSGNRVEEVASVVVEYLANSLNQYSSIGGTSRLYDSNGNLTSDGTSTYSWDAQSRLVSAQLDGGPGGTVSAGYTYDPFMRRVSKTINGVTTYFLWSRDDLVGEYDASGALQRRYLYADGFAPILFQDPGGPGGEQTYFAHLDHLDAPRILTDPSGEPVWRTRLAAFGKFVPDEDPDEDGAPVSFHIRLPGQYFDQESGLHYNGFRYYDAESARYLGPDPMGPQDHQNLYLYTLNDPMNRIDPTGLDVIGPIFQNRDRNAPLYRPQGSDVCPCGTSLNVDWNCVNDTWALLNGGNIGVTAEAAVGLGSVFWSSTSAAGAATAGAVGGVVGVWAGSTWLGAIAGCTVCLPD